MRTLRALALLATLATIGCSKKPQTFHVTSINPSDGIDVTGTFDGKEFFLHVNREKDHFYENLDGAKVERNFYEPIRVADVGKDLRATLDPNGRELLIDAPEPDGTRAMVHYTIESARVK